MQPYHDIERFLQFVSPDLKEIVFELRNLIADVAPDVTEDIRHGGLAYYFARSGGLVSAGICGISLKPDHIRLYFPHGAFIPDPQRLLQGTGKAMRFVELRSFSSVPWDAIRELIRGHATFDPRSLLSDK